MYALHESVSFIPINRKTETNPTGEEDMAIDEEIRDKILRYVRDYIISKNFTARQAFDIDTLTGDVMVHPYFIKRKLKVICGDEIPYQDIDTFIRKLHYITIKKQ